MVYNPDLLPFYTGQKPLKFTKVAEPIGFGFERPPVYYDFGDFLNLFIQDRQRIIGAQTCDRSGRLLAEARANYANVNGEQVIELEEIHYSKEGKPIFKCNSLIDQWGDKIKETDEIGKKERDYYFMWPTT